MLTRRTIYSNLRKKAWQGKSRSQGMVEFAIALPILLMLVFAIIDFSLLFSAWLLIQNIARQSVRYAVTGQFDTAHCPVGGCQNDADENEARLQSIYDEANSFLAGLFITGGASQGDPGFLKITVCTGAPFVTILPRMGSAQYGDCLPDEFPGEPGQPVIVMVDFNHPYLTPFLNEVWPMVHLASSHSGVVEQFRVSRLINLPPQILLPTNTPLPPTFTFTPSNTPTETSTPTNTNTPQPMYLEINWPSMDGQQIVTLDDTPFEAIAYDPDVGTTNGDGILNVTFSFSGPATIPGATEGIAAFCAFGGNGPCATMDPALFASLPNSNLFNSTNDYYMTVTATSADGSKQVTLVRRFKIMKPNTATPTFTITRTPTNTFTKTLSPTVTRTHTITRTPTNSRTSTLTPTMACSQFYISTAFAQTTSSSRPRLTISIRNSTSSYTAVIQSWTLDWAAYDASNPSQSFRRWYIGSTLIPSTADANSPTSWSLGTVNAAQTNALTLVPNETAQFRFDFSNVDAAWPAIVPASSFALTVNLDNGCVVTVSALPTPTWTSTRTFTNTYTPTNTVPTPTFTRTFTVTNTIPTPTFTRTFTRTNTVPTPTFTRTFTNTNTVPTPTFTLTYTRTNTVPTPTRTNTVPTPTFTFTSTVPTPTFTRTFTRTFTSTNTVPSPTPTGTNTFTPTRTYTPTTNVSTNTFTPSRTPTPSKTICTDC